MTRRTPPVVGFLVNPVAGLGGRLAFKGSDDAPAVAAALAAGAVPVAPARARRALNTLRHTFPALQVVAGAGPMGADLAREAGFDTTALDLPSATPTVSADTARAAAALAARGVDLLLFAGGDGTARDIAGAVGEAVPLLGIPSGVKMRSGVFGLTPEAAGEAAGRYLEEPARFPVVAAEIVDAPEGEETLGSRLYAMARVPAVGGRLQATKASAPRADAGSLQALCRGIAKRMEADRLYLLGPGTTTARVMAALGLQPTLLGVDAVRNGALVGADLDERGILALLERHRSASLILGVIGTQGFLLGRGNQQISAEVVRRVGVENLVVLAGAAKVKGLQPAVLHVDLGDRESEPVLSGYLRVQMTPEQSIVLRVEG